MTLAPDQDRLNLLRACVLVTVSLCGGLAAQDVPGSRAPLASGKEDPRYAPKLAGLRALEQGHPEEASEHLTYALQFDTEDQELLSLLLEANRKDVDRATLWAHALQGAASDDRGAYRPTREQKDSMPADLPFLEAISIARAAAVAELADLASRTARSTSSRTPGNPLVTRFLRSLAHDIAQDSAILWRTHGPSLNRICEVRTNAHGPVISALKKEMANALGNQRPGDAIELARCLYGLAAQSRFKDLKGPRPNDLTVLLQQAVEALNRARADLSAQSGAPLTIETLENMMLEERLSFTRDHQSFARPGVALSETSRYRIETICGHETLLGAARTVELHHDRLVNYYGQDPFVGRPGLVRVVPEAEGLESEGSPFWWAGGFQSGDVTTLRFNASSIASLGRGLTHELTHRFDGAIYPGIPSWLAEGKAVWTGAAYGPAIDPSFVANHVSFGTIENAMRKGYGNKRNLTKLIEGTIDDYRDNYVAGYALFVYLNTWEKDGRLLYHDELTRFQEQCKGRARNKPKALFEASFCDGVKGRPKGLGDFAKGFAAFLRGFYWLDRKPWTKKYTQKVGKAPSSLVYDFPTWQFSRNRAEPWFGQGQAARAGELLLSLGNTRAAAASLVWAFELDEWSTNRALQLADLLDELGDERSAWVLRMETRSRVPRDDIPNPGKSPLLTSLPKVRLYLDRLFEAAQYHQDAGRPLTTASLIASHDRISRRLGLEMMPLPHSVDGKKFQTPVERPPRYVGNAGWIEDELTSYEEHRVPDLWYDDGQGNLHVGRPKPRDKTGQMDRNAHYRHAFTRGKEWLRPGRYRIRTRIHFTTTYVNGAVIFGYTRRDRNLRLGFNAGDYMYSIGQKEAAGELDSVAVSLHAVRDGEAPWSGQTTSRGVNFDNPATFFSVEILVDGPLALAFVDGKPVGTYHSADGQPIEGYVGFASSFGAFRAETPTIEPLDRQKAYGYDDPSVRGLDLSGSGPVNRKDLLNRPARGFPLSPVGSVVVWVPSPTADDIKMIQEGEEAEEEMAFERRRRSYIASRSARSAAELLFKGGFDSRLSLVAPAFLGEEDREVLTEFLAREPPVTCPVIYHEKKRDITRQDGEPVATEMPMILFIDPVGVLRAVMPFMPGTSELPRDMIYWLNVYRGRNNPAQDS